MLPQFDPPPSATHEEQVTVTNTPFQQMNLIWVTSADRLILDLIKALFYIDGSCACQ